MAEGASLSCIVRTISLVFICELKLRAIQINVPKLLPKSRTWLYCLVCWRVVCADIKYNIVHIIYNATLFIVLSKLYIFRMLIHWLILPRIRDKSYWANSKRKFWYLPVFFRMIHLFLEMHQPFKASCQWFCLWLNN